MLHDFKNKSFIEAVQSFFKNLNVPFNLISEYQTNPENIIGDKKCNEIIKAIYPFGIVTDAIFNQDETKITQADLQNEKYDGILLFGVEVSKEKPTRSDLAEITRQINREFGKTPVVVVFKYGNQLTFANAERIDYKQAWREGEKVGKVSMLKDIQIVKPHAAHERILLDLKNKNANSFDELYAHWQKVLNTKELNKQFFKKIANWYFLSVAYSKFPFAYLKNDIKHQDKTNDELQTIANQKATIRFITRMIFVWFLKEKGLVSNDLFDKEKVLELLKKSTEKSPSNYYNAILQNLFFATLNKTKEHREFALNKSFKENQSNYDVNSLYRYENMFQDENPENIMQLFEAIPFLNGGLFDSLDNKEQSEIIDGFSRNPKWQAKMPDFLFFEENELNFDDELREIYGTKKEKYNVKGLFAIFNEYKFTIEENTPTETDVALDPYLLGEIFENLLAYYNPETETTARKGSGSFYTPQEIVNYMVDESLNAYLETKLEPELTNLQGFKNLEGLNTKQKTAVVQALSDVKILDPACGSGAFPMGVLYKMVAMLKHIDTDNSIWKQIQHDKIIGEKIAELEADKKAIQGLSDKQVKEKASKAVEERLNELETIFNNEYNFDDYARKLFIIQNCIYGVDIQDVAIQISKLRFFLSLIVDQKNNDIKPLPNLETKFVIANTLIGIDLPKFTVMGEDDHSQDSTKALKEALKNVREQHFKAISRKEKQAIKAKDKTIREKIANSLAEEANSKNEFEIEEQKKQIEKLKLQLFKAADLPETEEIETGTLFDTKKETTYPRKNKISELNRSIKNCEFKIVGLQTSTQAQQIRTQAMKIAEWDIYNQNVQADWFDAEWMFGLSPEESNVEVNQLNKQITATNNQIDALNNAIQHKIYKIARLQFDVTYKQLDVLAALIQRIKDQINTLYGTINNNISNVVNEPQNLDYEINSINIRIEETNLLLIKLTNEIKTEPSHGVFDIVIGNPPYIKEYTNKSVFDGLRQLEYYQGKMDLWYFFACNGIDLLNNNGHLCYIAPNNWTTNSGASKMRNKILEDTKISKTIDFGSYMVFESASIQTMVILFKKSKDNENYNFDLRKINSIKPNFDDVLDLIDNINTDNNIVIKPLFSKKSLKDKTFTFNNNLNEFVLSKIKEKHNIFLTDKEVANGIHPHYDYLNKKTQLILGSNFKVGQGIFVLNDNEKNNLELNEKELSLIKPYYTTDQLSKWYGNSINKEWIIYTDSRFNKKENIKPYPNLKKHLDQFQKIITSDNKPYGLHRAREEKFFIGEKIIVLRKCAVEPKFTFTDFDCYVSATFYIIKTERVNQKYLTGILNSKLIAFWLKNKGKMQGNNYQLDKEPLLEIPVFNSPTNQQPFISLVDQILDFKQQSKDTTVLEHQIDVMVYHLYELSYEEALIIDAALSEEDFVKYGNK